MLKRTTYPTQREPLRKRVASRDEFGKAEKKLVICTRCHQARVGKKWRTTISLLAKQLTAHKEGVHFVMCPACTMITKKLYEGEIVVHGVPATHEAELLHMIASFGARAQEIDPQDRISAIEHTKKGEFRITTTENQLAQKIAKKIRSAFKKTSMQVSHSKEPFQVTRIQMQFPV